MNCPSCNASITETDRFCEECGAAVNATSPPAASAPAASTLTAPNGCAKCGAAASAIDADGFCSQCGFRTEPTPEQRLVINLSPTFAGVSDPGLKHHRNEDHLAIKTVGSAHILVVCDGVSSSHRPELASQAASATTCNRLAAAALNQAQPIGLQQAFSAAQAAVCQAASEIAITQEPPSTTLIAAIVQNRRATIGWLGDSRAYWLAATGSQQLSTDDSWINDMVAAGRMTQFEAEKSPNAHAITRWLGADADADAEPTVVQFTIPGAGYFILCTDGLWNYAPDAQQIANLVNLDGDAITVAQRLTEFAIAQGGHDNITVAALKIEP